MNHQSKLKTTTNNNNQQQDYQHYNLDSSLMYNNNNIPCGDISPTITPTRQLTPTTTMQRPQLLMQYACGTILRTLNAKHSRAISPQQFGWLKHPRAISPQQVNDKAFQGNKPPTGE